jgi:hypothetical protein
MVRAVASGFEYRRINFGKRRTKVYGQFWIDHYKSLCNAHVRFFKNALAYFVSGTHPKGRNGGSLECPELADAAEKVFLHRQAHIFRAVGAAALQLCGEALYWLRFPGELAFLTIGHSRSFCFCTLSAIRPSARNDQRVEELVCMRQVRVLNGPVRQRQMSPD